MHTCNSIQIEQLTHLCMQQQLAKKEAVDLKDSMEGYQASLEGGKRREQLCFNIKIEEMIENALIGMMSMGALQM